MQTNDKYKRAIGSISDFNKLTQHRIPTASQGEANKLEQLTHHIPRGSKRAGAAHIPPHPEGTANELEQLTHLLPEGNATDSLGKVHEHRLYITPL